MIIEQFEVNRSDLSATQAVSTESGVVEEGEIICKVHSFALTANNITYGVVGEQVGYWNFFPASEGFGVIPVWGFADIIASRTDGIATGERLYGYFPMATHLVMRPQSVSDMRFVDGTAHRAALPPVYNSYSRVREEPGYDGGMDNERMLLAPLYATAYCLYDFLEDNDYFGADQVIILSASSKTAIGLAYALKDHESDRTVIGLTSGGNKARVHQLSLYDTVHSYSALDGIDTDKPSVIVDMSGNGTVLSALHARLGDNMKFTSNVGITHYADNEMGPDFIRERSEFFFAPAHIEKRGREWGPGEFQKRAMAFWHGAALRSRDWLKIREHRGMAALGDVYQELLAGRVAPDKGIIVSF